jgi:hypothetical protein
MGRNTRVEHPLSTFTAPWDQPFDLYLDQNGVHDPRARRCIVLSGDYEALLGAYTSLRRT